jgi:hypothetical protein
MFGVINKPLGGGRGFRVLAIPYKAEKVIHVGKYLQTDIIGV